MQVEHTAVIILLRDSNKRVLAQPGITHGILLTKGDSDAFYKDISYLHNAV